MNVSQEEDTGMLDKVSNEKAVELIPVSLYVVIMMLTGLCGNVLVCVFYCKKGRVTPTTRLIVAVAVIDTIICILMPKNILDLSLSYKFTSSALCKVNNFINHTTAVSSALVLVAVAVFRFKAVCKPFSIQFTLRHANISIGMAITSATLFSLPVLFTHESVSFNLTVSSDLTILGYDCNTSNKPSMKWLNLAVNALHLFAFISTTSTIFVLYGKIGINIMKYYTKKKRLTRACVSSVRKTSEHTNESERGIGTSYLVEVQLHEKKNIRKGVKNDEILNQRNEYVQGERVPVHVCAAGGLDKHDVESQELTDVNISLKEIETPSRGKTNTEATLTEFPKADTGGYKSETNMGVKYTHVTFDKEHNKSEDQVIYIPTNPETQESRKISAMAVKQTAMLFIITLIFYLSFLPYIAMSLARTLSKNKDGDDNFTNWIQLCTRSYLINSTANPFVYVLFNTEFRHFVKHIFCR